MKEHITQEVKDQWIADLRSGKYEQVRCTLSNGDNGYCCLGVLCHITKPDLYNHNYNYTYDTIAEYLRDSKSQEFTWDLASMNDSIINPKNFNQIADYLEENLHVTDH